MYTVEYMHVDSVWNMTSSKNVGGKCDCVGIEENNFSTTTGVWETGQPSYIPILFQ